eukprot:260901_1
MLLVIILLSIHGHLSNGLSRPVRMISKPQQNQRLLPRKHPPLLSKYGFQSKPFKPSNDRMHKRPHNRWTSMYFEKKYYTPTQEPWRFPDQTDRILSEYYKNVPRDFNSYNLIFDTSKVTTMKDINIGRFYDRDSKTFTYCNQEQFTVHSLFDALLESDEIRKNLIRLDITNNG